MTVLFLNIGEVLEIHRDQIDRYGGNPGIRDFGLLQSAVSAPASSFGRQYLHTDIYEMAAAYMFHIIQNHPFIDGNKRTGAVAALVFLELNGIRVDVEESEFERMVWNVAQGKTGKSELTLFFQTYSSVK